MARVKLADAFSSIATPLETLNNALSKSMNSNGTSTIVYEPLPAPAPPVSPPPPEYVLLTGELNAIRLKLLRVLQYEKYLDSYRESHSSTKVVGFAEFQFVVETAASVVALIDKSEALLRQGIGTQECADSLAKHKERAYFLLTGVKLKIVPLVATPIPLSKFPRCPGCRKPFMEVRKGSFHKIRGSRALLCHRCLEEGRNGRLEYSQCRSCKCVDKIKNLHACHYIENQEFCKDCLPAHQRSYPQCVEVDVVAPWVKRGMKPKFYKEDNDGNSPAKWGFDSTRINPVQIAADYYILLSIRDKLYESPHGMLKLHGFNEEARLRLKEMVEQYDPVFCAYVDMVVGGELRYNGATHAGGLRKQRHQSWNAWRRIRAEQGPQALLDAAFLFRRISHKGGIGGEKWAVIAETLHARVSNVITPELWLDRVFSLQHNGGIVLNKVSWLEDPHRLTHYIGPMHSQNPTRIDLLSWFASTPVRSLLWDYINVLRRERHGWSYVMSLGPLPETLTVAPKTDNITIETIQRAMRYNSLKEYLKLRKRGLT